MSIKLSDLKSNNKVKSTRKKRQQVVNLAKQYDTNFKDTISFDFESQQKKKDSALSRKDKLIKKYDRLIEKTDNLILKAEERKRDATNITESITEKNTEDIAEIPASKLDDVNLLVMLEDFEPQQLKFFIQLMKDLDDIANGISEKAYVNLKMPNLFGLKQNSLKTYIWNLTGDGLIVNLNVNPVIRSKPSRKMRVIQMDTDIKNKLLEIHSKFMQ